MPIPTQCTHCGKAYQVAESTLGKQVKCQACEKVFVVARSSAATGTTRPAVTTQATAGRAQATAGRGGTATAAPPTANRDQAERTRIAKLEAQFGLQALPPNPNRVFPEVEYRRPKGAPDPLANHVVENPGFEQISEAEFQAHQEDLLKQHEREKMERLAQLSGDDELISKGISVHWLMMVAMGQLILGIVMIPLAMISPAIAIVFLLIVTIAASLAPNIEMFLALRKSKQMIGFLYMLIPFYNLYYYFSNFKIFKDHFAGSLAILFAIPSSWAIFIFGAAAQWTAAKAVFGF